MERMEEGGRRGYGVLPSVAGSRAAAPQLHCICDYASGSPAVRLQVLRMRRTELYLEIPVINEAGAALCTEEVDEK